MKRETKYMNFTLRNRKKKIFFPPPPRGEWKIKQTIYSFENKFYVVGIIKNHFPPWQWPITRIKRNNNKDYKEIINPELPIFLLR